MSYENSNPTQDKFIFSDGSIRQLDGTIIQQPTEFRKKQYEQATPIPAKFLHADGTIDENIGGGGSSIKYKLYAYECDSVPDSFGYTEKENPIVGDVLLLPENIGSGNITDPSQLKQVFTITEVHEDGTIYAQQDESSSPIHFSRDFENDYEETITDVRDLTDISGNGLLMSQKGTVFKGLNVNIEGGGDISIELPSWADGELSEDTIPPAGTKIAWLNYSHNPYHWIEVYDGNTPIDRNTSNYVGKCGDNFLFIYIYAG